MGSGSAVEERGPAAGETAEPSTAGGSQASTSKPLQEEMLAWMEPSGVAADEGAAPLGLEELDLADGADGRRPEGIELEQPVSLDEPVEPLSDLVGRDDKAPGVDLHVEAQGWRVETAEDIVLESAGGSEFQVANASEELLTTRSSREPEPRLSERPGAEREPLPPGPPPADLAPGAAASGPVDSGSGAAEEADQDHLFGSGDPASAEPAPETGAPPSEPAWAAGGWARPVAEPPRRAEPDLLVTESMADLLLQQGHTAEALTVYRHLAGRAPDQRFEEKIAELERAGTPAPGAAPVPEPEAVRPAFSPAPAASYSIHETQGQSVQSFLRGMLGARPPAAPASAPVHAEAPPSPPDAAVSGAPTRPAHDSLSLSSVFGEESTPTPPAVPAAGPPGGAGQGGVSYDEFFGGEGGGATRQTRTPDAKSDDLDQFHAWLQNLKR
jgi:hypothetical protein